MRFLKICWLELHHVVHRWVHIGIVLSVAEIAFLLVKIFILIDVESACEVSKISLPCAIGLVDE